MADDKVLDMIVRSLEKANDKLDSLEGIRSTLDARGREIEAVVQEQRRMNTILDRNTRSLEEHMLRTELAEKAIENHHARLLPLEKEIGAQKAVRVDRTRKLKTAALVAACTGGCVGLVTLAIKLIELYRSMP